MTEPVYLPVTAETHERFTAAQDALNLGSDAFVRLLLDIAAPSLLDLAAPSILAATDRLASDADRIYSVLP